MQLDALLNDNLINFEELIVVAKPESMIDFWADFPFLYEQEFSSMYPQSPSSFTKNSYEAYNRPHTCSYCSRRFTRRHDMQRHTRVHTGIKPYTCPCCQRSFSRSDARRRHFLLNLQCGSHAQVIKIHQVRRRKH